MNTLLRSLGLTPPSGLQATAPPTWTADVPAWLAQLVERDAVLAGMAASCLGPHPSDLAVEEIAHSAGTGAACVFLVHGNVRDYAFHPRVGFAPLPAVLGALWREGIGFGNPPSPVVLSISASVGVEVADEARASRALRDALRDHRAAVRALPHEDRLHADLAFVDRVMNESEPALVLFERADLLFPADGDAVRSASRVERVLRWAGRARHRDRNAIVVLLAESPDDVHPELRKRVNGLQSVRFPRPRTTQERLRFMIAAVATLNGAVEMPATRLTGQPSRRPTYADELERIAGATTGLNLAGLEACVLTVPAERGLLEWATSQRTRLLRAESQGLLVVEEPREVRLVGRLAALADELGWIAEAMSTGRSDLVPMGMLFVGVPGTGKSYLASALAARCAAAGVQYVRLGDFRDMWVGSTERNFTRALELIATFGRVIVFMDELDQSEGGSRSDTRHETSKRVFGKLLEFMAAREHRGNVLWIAATNRPDQLDPAIVRPGRFDKIVQFQPPDEEECGVILQQKLEATGTRGVATHGIARACAARALVGAEIELIVTEASRRAARRGAPVDEPLLLGLVGDFRDDYKRTPQYARMAQECARFARFGS